MRTSDKGVALIKQFEGLETVAYQCDAKKWTLAFGHTKGVKPGDTCTEEQAEAWLREDLQEAENAIQRLVTRNLTQNQFDALVSLVFNIGAGNFAESNLLEKLNAMDDAAVVQEFAKWRKAGGKVNRGLVRRRQAEAEMFAALPWVTFS